MAHKHERQWKIVQDNRENAWRYDPEMTKGDVFFLIGLALVLALITALVIVAFTTL